MKLREYRDREGLSQAAFAERVKVNQSTVAKWEAGRMPDLEDLRNIAVATAGEVMPNDFAGVFANDPEPAHAGSAPKRKHG